jgi:hypothetical protein
MPTGASEFVLTNGFGLSVMCCRAMLFYLQLRACCCLQIVGAAIFSAHQLHPGTHAPVFCYCCSSPNVK